MQPQRASVHKFMIQLAFTMVASESGKIYKAVSDGTQTFAAKFFEMKRYDAVIAMDIYKRTWMQAGRLCEFYKMCNSIDIGRGNEFIKIEQVLKQDAIGILSLAIEIIMGHYGQETVTILIYDVSNIVLYHSPAWCHGDHCRDDLEPDYGKVDSSMMYI
uniref:Putative clathrin assembly protein At5g35200 n=1 Tax=Tanacetum cinerariifolium TaxID=118510 RepID=A0A6L2K1I6_TANCI|nr:putative clathrin assembly protein At5g35200 [Tanacetum cinerariifolium]